MTRTLLLSFTGAAAAVVLAFSVAQAAPATSLDGLKAAATEQNSVEQASWHRRCWWHHGHRHCRRVWHRWW